MSGTVRPGTLSALLVELATAPPAPELLEAELRPGLVVDRFELVRELGRGGFGVVWEAKDRELGRRVAFKAVRAGTRRDLREERLLVEAEAAAQLSHPNIVTLHDVGRSQGGPYLVLELLEGKTLAERLREGPLAAREAAHVATEVARGIAHAHAHGVVHRDLKPANVFLCTDGAVKVLDFGLAYAFGHRREGGGTSGYMAPEQVEGAPEDERTDVWALGVMLFEMLSGKRPFEGERALRGPPPALEVVGLPRLGELVERMLAARPVDRPRDGGEALEALAAIEQDMASTSVPGSAAVRIRRRTRARRIALVVTAIALVGAAAALGRARLAAWLAGGGSARVPVTLAVLPLANLSGDASQDYFADGITDEITGKLSRLAGLAVTSRSSVARYKGSGKGAREIGRELGVAYLVEGSVRRAGDRIRVGANMVKTADGLQVWSESIEARFDDILAVQEQVATRIVEALQVRLSPDEARLLQRWGTRNAVAYDEYLKGQALVERHNRPENVEAARAHLARALEIDPAFAPAMADMALVESLKYRNSDANPERLATARALLDRALAIDPRLYRALIASAFLRGVQYDYRGSAEDMRRASAVEPRSFLAWDGVCWAASYETPPELAEAERACRRALELQPGFGEALYHLVRVLALQARVAEAEHLVTQLEKLSPESPYLHSARFWVHLCSNRPREALVHLEKQRSFRGTGLWGTWRAIALTQAGDLDGALAALDGALAKGYRDVAQLHGDPFLEPLRRDRRFAPLLAKYGIAPPLTPSRSRPRRPGPSAGRARGRASRTCTSR